MTTPAIIALARTRRPALAGLPGQRAVRALAAVIMASMIGVTGAAPVQAQRAVRRGDTAWSRGVPAGERAAAEALFLEGNELFESSLFAEAADRYRAALARWEHPAIHLNLAKALILLQRPVEAVASLRVAVRYPEAHDSAEQYEWAEESLERLEAQLVEIEVTCADGGAEVTVDGARLFVAPGHGSAYFLPGQHVVVAEKRGYVAVPVRLVLEPGERASVRMNMMSLAAARAAQRRYPAWTPWAVLGSGAALGVAGGAMRWRAGDTFARFDAAFSTTCPAGCPRTGTPPELRALYDRGTREGRLSAALFITGGLAVAGGVTMLVLDRPEPVIGFDSGSGSGAGAGSQASRASRGRATGTGLMPLVSPEVVGAVWGGRF
jgi:hypothetical protein